MRLDTSSEVMRDARTSPTLRLRSEGPTATLLPRRFEACFVGSKPGETKPIRGKIYFAKSNIPSLLKRYEKDFPEHVR